MNQSEQLMTRQNERGTDGQRPRFSTEQRLLITLRASRRALCEAAQHLPTGSEADQLCADALEQIWDLISEFEHSDR